MGRTAGFVGTDTIVEPTLEGTERRFHERVLSRERNIVLPAKEDTYGNIEGLMNHFKIIMDYHGIRPPKGRDLLRGRGGKRRVGFLCGQ